MGDHRASVIIEFEMHGIKKKIDFWLNYYPEPSCAWQIDSRVLDFLSEAYTEAMSAYDKKENRDSKGGPDVQ